MITNPPAPETLAGATLENFTPKALAAAQAKPVKPPVTLKIVPAEALRPLLRILLYGDTGVGKTFLACEASKVDGMKPVLLADFEQGYATVRGWPDLDVAHCRTVVDLESVLLTLAQDQSPYRTLVVDSLTELHFRMMEDRLGVVGRASQAWAVSELQDWLYVQTRMRRLLRRLKQYDVHLICTALSQHKDDQAGGGSIVHTKVNVSGQLADEVGAQFDIVGYLSVRTVRTPTETQITRFLQTQPFNRRAAKDRWGGLPAELENPTMQAIYDSAFKQPKPEEVTNE